MKPQVIKTASFLFSITVGLLFFSCEKNDDFLYKDVTGTYVGTLTSNLANKSSVNEVTEVATIVVSSLGDQIQLHCYSNDFDATAMLNIYNHYDKVMVCLTGQEFENMYGHRLGQGHMNGKMQYIGTEWMQHLNNEHLDGDEHFGGFDMLNHSFNYTFRMENGDFHFQGIKN